MTLSGTGTINLGSGNLTTNDLASGISGGSLSVANQYVGNGGTGTFTQSGGTNSIGSYTPAPSTSATTPATAARTTSAAAASSSAYDEYVGYSGTGTFTQSGGTNSVSYGSLYLGYNAGSSGTYSLSGSGQLSARLRVRGLVRHGDLHAVGRDQQSASYLYLGDNAGGSGTYNLSGSGHALGLRRVRGLRPARGPSRSRAGPTISTATTVRSILAVNAGSSGTYNLSGSGLLSANSEYVGYSGTGTFTQSGGTHSIANSLYLGYNAGSSGTYSLSGSGQLSAASEYVGYNPGATALFQQTGGTNTVSRPVDRQWRHVSAWRAASCRSTAVL